MDTPDFTKIVSFSSPTDLSLWLEKNHDKKDELWIKVFKKHTKIPTVSWDEIVIESLCWGWIDGVKKSIDAEAYLQRITPRKARSEWSKRNTEHVERLIKEGRMQPSGLVPVAAAKKDGRWGKAYSVSEMEVPLDFLAALENEPKAKAFFNTLNKSSRFTIAYGLESAKKPETRERRFKKFMDGLRSG